MSFEDTREVVARLGEITAPALVLWGEREGWLRPSVGDRLAAAISGARRETVPGAGHFIAEDEPRGTTAALLEFFAQSGSAGDAADLPLPAFSRVTISAGHVP